MNSLHRKEKEAIKFIKKAYPLALDLNEDGFHVAFSGGKDSQALYHLMEKSGCRFTAHMQVTSVDPPQLMKFIRANYPNVQLHLPKENMYKLIVRKGILPMRQVRYCCEVLKEQAGAGTCTCVGVRAAESNRRSKRSDIEVHGLKGLGFNIEDNKLITKPTKTDLFDIQSDSEIHCVGGQDKIILSPIFNWSDADVWNYIRGNKLEYCELYDMGFHRIGCLFCPIASGKTKMSIELKLFRGVADKIYIRAIRELRNQGKYQEFASADDVFMWWISNQNRDEWLNRNKQNKLFTNPLS